MDARFSGKTALHCAAAAGKTTVVEALVDLGANLESEVCVCVCVCIDRYSGDSTQPIILCLFGYDTLHRMMMDLDHSITVLIGQLKLL